jgi:glycosyltransferase involved in cell wall biosynthesis
MASAAADPPAARVTPPSRVTVDVEELFQFSAQGAGLRDTQVVAARLAKAMQSRADGSVTVTLARHDAAGETLVPIAAIDAGRHAAAPAPGADQRLLRRVAARLSPRARQLAYRLPDPVRVPLIEAARNQIHALRAASRLPAGAWRSLRAIRAARAAARAPAMPAGTPPLRDRAGEVILLPGTPWFRRDIAGPIAQARRRGATVALLVHEVAPLRRPGWCEPAVRDIAEAWLRRMLPLTDRLLTFSDAAGEAVARHAATRGIPLTGDRATVPAPSGFARIARPFGGVCAEASRAALPTPEGAWCVVPVPLDARLVSGTPEARRAHEALLRVWRRLIDAAAPGPAPILVFAGHAGWLAASLATLLGEDEHLAAHVVQRADPSDAELTALFGGCLFAVFPWAHEGWGDPVAESLSLGCPCVVSAIGNAAPDSVPDAALARRFDPSDEAGALDILRAAVAAGTAGQWRSLVAARAVPVGWDETAAAVLRALHAPPQAEGA